MSILWTKRKNDIDSIEVNIGSDDSTLDLKAIREAKGLTLESMVSSTRVSLSTLKAIERQTFELLPEPVYARAFIGVYAHELGIDGEEILSRYDVYLAGLEPDENRNKILKKLAQKKGHAKFWIWLVIASCVIICIGFFSFYQWSQDGGQAMRDLTPVEDVKQAGELQGVSDDMPAAPEQESIAVEEVEIQDSSERMTKPGNDEVISAEAEGDDSTRKTEEADATDISNVEDIQDTAHVIGEDIHLEKENVQSAEGSAQQEITDQQSVAAVQPPPSDAENR